MTSSVTWSCRPAFTNVTSTTKLERNEIRIHFVEHLNAAPPQWKTDNVQKMDTVSTVTAGSITLGVVVGRRQHIAYQLFAKAESDRFCASPRNPWAAAASTTFFGCTATRSCRRMEPLERLLPGFTEDSLVQATLSAGQSGKGSKRARDTAAPAHLGALVAAQPRIQDDTRLSYGWLRAETILGNSPRCGD